MSRFVHLHTHSHYSLLQALPKIKALVKAAIDNAMPAVALTDNGNMYGAIQFYKECIKQNIKPILGVDFYVAARTRHDKEPRIDNRRTRLLLLAKDASGYKSLIKLVTDSFFEGFYYKPRIDRELIEKYPTGLLCIMPSFSGEITQAIKAGNIDRAREIAQYYKNIFKDDFYIEITHHPEIEEHEGIMEKLIAFAREENIQIVAGHDVYYIKADDKEARQTLLAIQDQFSERTSEDNADLSFITSERAEELFKDTPDALDNCQKIVEKINLQIELGKWLFPEYVVESGLPADDELRNLTYAGLERRRMELDATVKERIEYELKVIKDKGYAPYFLVVADLLRYAYDHGILTNIRGSVAGSIVTYLTGITNVDPIAFNLPFERFLNPERPSAPDIDMDFADNRRDEMITYSRQKYGQDKVAQIGTFGTMAARGAVKDVARALKYPYTLGDKISKLIPMGQQGFPMTIERALADTPELKEIYDKDADVKKIIEMAKKIEGCARHISVHAAGVVIAPIPITEVVPLQLDPKGEGRIITQYDMRSVDEENAGLLKFDFLGLKNLAQLADALDLTEKIEGIKLDIDLIPLDDKKTFEMLARGDTTGVFQLSGSGITQALKQLKPTTIHDINVMVALYRPGPMETIDEYIARKHGKHKTIFYHPKMKAFLDRTYGLLVYQDDLLMTAIELAGYTWGEVDKFRKAVGKKIPEEMAKQHVKFVDGCISHSGISKKLAEDIWKLFEPFQGYGFNKAHAASYGNVAYKTAYMKANFPAIYMAAILTGAHGDVVEIGEYIAECKRMNLAVLPPDLNESFGTFTVIKGGGMNAKGDIEPDKIRFGLYSIKNFGEGIADTIIEERKKNGRFKTLEEFLNRIKDKNLNKKSLEALIKSGAMDEYGDRGVMLANLPDLLEYNKEQHKQAENQTSLFGAFAAMESEETQLAKAKNKYGMHLKLKEEGHAQPAEKLAWEKELLGLFVSGHPLDKYAEIFKTRELNIAKVKLQIEEEDKKKAGEEAILAPAVESGMIDPDAEPFPSKPAAPKPSANKPKFRGKPKRDEGKQIVLAGIIEEAKEIATKKDPTVRMMFMRLADFSGSIEVVVFPKAYEQYKNILQVDRCVVIKGKTSSRDGNPSFMADAIKPLA
ncbi:MAG: hypothetical protein RL094_309 [Candidatus Parcubacteria bacterium]|jgi:DNA polymerase-3 subunit alpha